MTALGQRTLVSLLTDLDAVEVLAAEGLDLECVPNEKLREVVAFSLDYFHSSARTKAPSSAVLQTEFTPDLFHEHDVDFDNVDESIQWALDDLKGSYVHKQVATFNKNLAISMTAASNAERVQVASDFGTALFGMATRLQSHESIVDVRTAMPDALLAYEARAADGGQFSGMTFGLGMIDNYTRGIKPGELACLAAGPKTGKSYFLLLVALRQWEVGRSTVLYTLENSVEMTMDRLACLGTGIDADSWEEGTCTEAEIAQVQAFIARLQASDVPLTVIQPAPGQRSVEAIVLDARIRGADNLIIDQLTFMEPIDEKMPRHLQIRQITHDLKTMISTGRDKMSCLLAHQINRDGVKMADKVGYLEMFHLAEGSEVERTCDWVFGLYRSLVEAATGLAKFQTLASRRKAYKHFQMVWDIKHSIIATTAEIDLVAA